MINMHCFSDPARERECALQRANQRARVTEHLNLFHETASKKTMCAQTKRSGKKETYQSLHRVAT